MESDSEDGDTGKSSSPLLSPPARPVQVEPLSKPHEGGMTYQRTTQFKWGNTEPCDLGFSPEDLSACLRVVNALGSNIKLFKLPPLKPLRAALHPLIEEQMKNYTKNPKEIINKQSRKRKKNLDEESRVAEMEKEFINNTQLRALRMQRLDQLNAEGVIEVPRILDGVALPTVHTSKPLLTGPGTDQLQLPAAEITNPTVETYKSPGELRSPIACYICKKPFVKLHFFYDQLCPDCAEFNYRKRNELVDMTGKVCLVTGARYLEYSLILFCLLLYALL